MVTHATIPETMHSVLAARIDRLGGLAKGLVAAAAVTGDRDLLECVARSRPASWTR